MKAEWVKKKRKRVRSTMTQDKVNQDRHPNFRDKAGKLYLVRCFACNKEIGTENWAPAVAGGQCAWCGWKENMTQDKELEGILEKLMKECFDLGITIGMKRENYKGDVAPIRDKTIYQIQAHYKKKMLSLLPEWKPAHTYASENADDYYMHDEGFNDCLKQIKQSIEKEM